MSKTIRDLFRSVAVSSVVCLLFLQQLVLVAPAQTSRSSRLLVSDGIVISQVYGGGGNSGATFTHDFVELFNRGSVPISLDGWSIQYASSTGTGNFGSNSGQITELPDVILQPGQYFLVQEAGGATGSSLPTPDFIDTSAINLSGTNGKVALANVAESLGCNGGSTPCSPEQLAQIVDLVGFGNANYFEGAGAVPTLSNSTAALRNGGGCSDSDNNNIDFTVLTPAPRNSSTALNPCSPTTTNPSGVGAANPDTVLPGESSLLTVTVTPGTNPPSTGLTVEGDLTSIGGSDTQTFFDDGTNGDETAGDNIFTYEATVSESTTVGEKTLAATIADAQSRTSTANISLTVTTPSAPGQPLPFSQNWSNTGMISTNNDWSGVPGIVGYRGDAMAGGTAVDPQTILQDGSGTPVNVVANQTNPGTQTSGGIAEFELSNPVVAFQGSGTARAPHIVISINTVGAENVAVTYNLRDLDDNGDNSVQPVALQYRIGDTGNFTNIPAAFVADASTGPNEATLVTPVGVLLPAALEGHSLVQLRIITTDAIGSDEWIGIDDINIASNGTLPMAVSAAASPSTVNAGSSTLLTATVTPGTNPESTGITVVGDLSSIGGSATQQFYDDGTSGDVTPGDNVFSYTATVPVSQSSGTRTISVTASDEQSRTASASIGITVRAVANPMIHLTMGNPSGATTDENQPDNYLMLKDQYVLSYSRSRGTANWVAWQLDSSWLGSAPRQDDFRPDDTLPLGWYQVTQFDYSGSGFDRGHHTPSGDRTSTIPDNSATFLMTNMMPQAPDNNQGPWESLESYSRTVVGQGNELYIYMGGTSIGGSGSNGGTTTTIAGGNVTVPAYTWKVIMVLPSGDDDVNRVDENTRVFAVILPNRQGLRTDPWQKYVATVDQVEALTGYDFFSNVDPAIQAVIESRIDPASNTAPETIGAGTFTNLAIDAPNTTLTGNVTVNGVLRLGGSTLRTGTNNRIILGANATVDRISGMVEGSLEKEFKSESTFEYPVGANGGYSPVTAAVTAVSPNSSLTISATEGVHPNAPEPNQTLGRFWSITENGDITANLLFQYLDRDVPIGVRDETTFELNKYEGSFEPVATTVNATANTLATNGVTEFSDWTAFGDLAPTTAYVAVSGRVTDWVGSPLANAQVRLTDPDGHMRAARTNSFGYYRIEGVEAGITYTAIAIHKEHSFAPTAITVQDDVTNLNFVAASEGSRQR